MNCLQSWQDWRSDTKAKALKHKKYRGGTGGGPSPAPLSQMEETLLQFCGIEMVEGVEGVADPLEVTFFIVTMRFLLYIDSSYDLYY